MGISGLLPFLKNASRPANVEEFSGKTAAIDVYCWLHKGAFGCAEKLVLNQPTNGYVTYVMRYVDMLLHFNVKPILVFDGRNLPSKSETEKKRRENREKFRKMAKECLRDGKSSQAREYFQRCVDITPSMAREVIEACTERNIDCIVAPYEADAQLAFLNISGIADFIISEDSDLAPFGGTKILFKMDMAGNGTLIEKDKLYTCLGIRADNFTFEKFRYMCIMAGCDYHPSLPGIGIGKSCKFWGKVTNPDLLTVLPKIPSYLNMGQLEVSDEYVQGFIRANETFLYQLVYDPRERKLRPLNEYPNDVDNPVEKYNFAGNYVPEDLAFQMALGNADLHSLTLVKYFDPDQDCVDNPTKKPRYGNRAKHASIWWCEERRKIQSFDIDIKEQRKEKEVKFQKAFGIQHSGHETPKENIKKRSAAPATYNTEEEKDSDFFDIYSSASKKQKLEFQSDKNPDYPEQRRVVVSRYFFKNCAIQNQKKMNQDLTDKGPRCGEWLEELDDPCNAVRQGVSQKVEEVKENFHLTKLASLPLLKNDPATRRPFKPVVSQSSQSQPVDKNESPKIRNPFAKASALKIKSDSQEDDDLEFLVISQTPVEISSSQLSVRSLDDDIPSSSQTSTENEADKKTASPEIMRVFEKVSPVISESPYFRKNVCQNVKQSPKARVPISGLLRRGQSKRPADAKQPKVFEMWAKAKL